MRWFFFLSLSFLLAFAHPLAAEGSLPLDEIFRTKGVTGTVVIRTSQNDRQAQNANSSTETFLYNPDRARTRFLPASTFKIPHTLIALESSIITPTEVLPWDKKTRELPAWNRDHTLDLAFKNSTVWFYQALARRIGPARMQKYITDFAYGNERSGPTIDSFWLNGNLRISAIEQIDFLERLHSGRLPVSKQSLKILKEMMRRDEPGQSTLYGKTGLVTEEIPVVGWFVGYEETEKGTYYFATNLSPLTDRPGANFAADRIDITRKALRLVHEKWD